MSIDVLALLSGPQTPLYLAPQAGVSESPFRRLCRRYGADVVVSEFVSAVGIVMGVRRSVDGMLDGWLILFLNIPALVTIILCYVWFGLTEVAAITAVAVNKIPNVIVTVREGARSIQPELMQVAGAYRLPRHKAFYRVYMPQMYPYLMASIQMQQVLL